MCTRIAAITVGQGGALSNLSAQINDNNIAAIKTVSASEKQQLNKKQK
jgi:hypothetical protein